jgi:hypothetical protein
LLTKRADVDASRLAYAGHSFGAQCGAILSAVDKRLQGVVLMAGIPDVEAIYRDSKDPDVTENLEGVPKKKLDAFFKKGQLTAPVRYVPHAKAPLLFQFARYERAFDMAAMERYAKAAKEPKKVLWYDTGHELNDPKALFDRAKWLGKWVGLGEVKLGK